jgi:hypothetical protein
MVWFNFVFDSGLDPNLFGVIATLFFITSLLIFFEFPKSPGSWILLFLKRCNLANVALHRPNSTPSSRSLHFFRIISTGTWRGLIKYGLPFILASVGFVVILIRFPEILTTLLGAFTARTSADVTGSSFFSMLLSGAPFLSYVALFVSDAPFLMLVVLALVSFYYSLRRGEFFAYSLLLVWLILLYHWRISFFVRLSLEIFHRGACSA